MNTTIVRRSDIARSGRVRQIEGLFDIAPTEKAETTFEVDMPLPDDWNIGLIVGPSGSGKSTILRECFGELRSFDWDPAKSILDGFPADMKVQEVVQMLSSVGFSSPPAWLRPFGTLSNGEQFRVELARTLAEAPDVALVDEFTSVVDRTVARIGSAAVAKAVRRAGKRLVAASCHYDVVDWLQPDWIYDTATGKFTGRSLQRRPAIDIEVHRAPRGAWRIFRHHHYLNTSLATGAKSFVGLIDGQPAAFHAGMHFVHPKVRDMMRGHRTVCLPDFQGVGIGNALQDFCASLFTAIGWRYVIVASHPAVIRSMARSTVWDMSRKPGFVPQPGRTKHGTYGMKGGHRAASSHSQLRRTASFTYVGPPATPDQVAALAADLPRPRR